MFALALADVYYYDVDWLNDYYQWIEMNLPNYYYTSDVSTKKETDALDDYLHCDPIYPTVVRVRHCHPAQWMWMRIEMTHFLPVVIAAALVLHYCCYC